MPTVALRLSGMNSETAFERYREIHNLPPPPPKYSSTVIELAPPEDSAGAPPPYIPAGSSSESGTTSGGQRSDEIAVLSVDAPPLVENNTTPLQATVSNADAQQ